MMTLIVGGAASGKSQLAEALAVRDTGSPRVYLATMEPFDQECLRRIEKHRRMRADKGFETVECYRNLAEVQVSPNSTVLLECMGNLAANELYGGSGCQAEERILSGIRTLRAQCGHLIVVSNEVCSGGSRYEGDTIPYLKLLGRLNCRMAAMADHVSEAVCGVHLWHKGGL